VPSGFRLGPRKAAFAPACGEWRQSLRAAGASRQYWNWSQPPSVSIYI